MTAVNITMSHFSRFVNLDSSGWGKPVGGCVIDGSMTGSVSAPFSVPMSNSKYLCGESSVPSFMGLGGWGVELLGRRGTSYMLPGNSKVWQGSNKNNWRGVPLPTLPEGQVRWRVQMTRLVDKISARISHVLQRSFFVWYFAQMIRKKLLSRGKT